VFCAPQFAQRPLLADSLSQVLLDLPATRARCRKVFFTVAFDFWLPAIPTFDFVTECFEPRG